MLSEKKKADYKLISQTLRVIDKLRKTLKENEKYQELHRTVRNTNNKI